jgi:hypothetical protein
MKPNTSAQTSLAMQTKLLKKQQHFFFLGRFECRFLLNDSIFCVNAIAPSSIGHFLLLRLAREIWMLKSQQRNEILIFPVASGIFWIFKAKAFFLRDSTFDIFLQTLLVHKLIF